ncbi:biotin-dependent carboxyltransferase family protein [Secundilactobacillus yichangensis]|uniref:5-oxoprolinase subunit C family protein n=1 Tax=Secundilactobacillus yichangensis TaxID=2799580 RepID=UPI001944BB82|nr:biotin-dependent carboxyltransferase family protein [Secundilactobacillus yichangensis]
MALKIQAGGLLTTVQDQGRVATQSSGFSVSGVMDFDAANVANLLVGNSIDAAVLESSLQGPTLTFTQASHFAVTGAIAEMTLNDQPIETYREYYARRGDQLSIGHYTAGRFGYLAVYGGIQVPVIMGSRSTSLKYQLGGYQGRQLQAGDSLKTVRDALNQPRFQQATAYPYSQRDKTVIRVTPGPQYDDFSAQTRQQLTHQAFEISQQSDRMGARLQGQALDVTKMTEMLSEGTVLGGVQLPRDGQPIVLLADRQTTGGYPVIAVVARVDLPKLVQLTPGQQVQFRWLDLAESQILYRQNYGSDAAIKATHQFQPRVQLNREPAERIATLFTS